MDILKEMMDLGMGIVALTKTKAQKIANEMVKEGKLKKEEGRVLVQKLVRKGKVQQKDLEKKMSAVLKSTLSKLDLATKDDIRKLQVQITQLKKRVR